MSKKRLTVIIVLAALTAATLAFIWGNSVLGREASASQSSEVYETVAKPVFDAVLGEDKVTHNDFRKMTHFCEFMPLGLEACALVAAIKTPSFFKKDYLKILPYGFYVAFIDETIQVFSGRGAEIKDVWLDFSGYVCALFLSFVVFVITERIKARKSEKSAEKSEGGAEVGLKPDSGAKGELKHDSGAEGGGTEK